MKSPALGSPAEDPLLAGGALALALALLGWWLPRGAKPSATRRAGQLFQDSGNPDSFFGASGGQHVDTADSSLTTGASSMSHSPSQLDVGGDVDPVAEADVYLAYGRDLQAEEILKEAMRHNPGRVAIPVKLAEIYAKRQDRKGAGVGRQRCLPADRRARPRLVARRRPGRTLDADNALYQPGGRPAAGPDGEGRIAPEQLPAPGRGRADQRQHRPQTRNTAARTWISTWIWISTCTMPASSGTAPSPGAMAAAETELAATQARRGRPRSAKICPLAGRHRPEAGCTPEATPFRRAHRGRILTTEPAPLDFGHRQPAAGRLGSHPRWRPRCQATPDLAAALEFDLGI